MPAGYSTLIPGDPSLSTPADNAQALGDYAERGRSIETASEVFLASQVYASPVAKWTSIVPVLTVTVPEPLPGSAQNAGNPFLWYEVQFAYHLIRSDGASPGIVGGISLIDSIEMPTLPAAANPLKTFQGTNGVFINSGLTSTATYQATPGAHVMRPVIYLENSSTLTVTLTLTNFRIQGGVL